MAKESRLAEIFRQELKKDKGLMAAFLTGAGERAKEKSDFRNYLPKSGITGAITERMFGKPYRAGSSNKNKDSKVERTGDISSSKYIPGMAKDMNLMRLNMQKMVTIWGGKPSKSVSTNMLKGTDTKIASKEAKEDSGSSGGGLLGGLGSLGGGLMSLGGSLFSGIASVFGGIASGVGGILGGLGKVFSGAGLIGLIAMAGIGWLISELFTNVDFSGFSDTFSNIAKTFKDLFLNEGEQSFSKRWSNFVGSIVAVKDKLVEMVTVIGWNIERLGQLFNDLGGGYGIFGMLLGAAAAAGIASSWQGALVGLAKNPAGLVAILAGLAIGKLVTDYRKGAAENEANGTTMGSNQRNAVRNVGGVSGEDNILILEKAKLERRLTELDDKAIEAGRQNGTNKPSYTPEIKRQISNAKSEIAKIDTTLGENKTIRDDNERDEGARRRSSYPSPEKLSTSTGNARSQVDSFLGRAVTDKEYDALLKGVSAEASGDAKERAAVASVILNRAKLANSSIIDVLNSAGQFQAITGPKGDNGTVDKPWSKNATKIASGVENAIAENLNTTTSGLTGFASTNPGAWKDVGGEERMNKYLAGLNGPTIGQTKFSSGSFAKPSPTPLNSPPADNKLAENKKEETKVASYYDQMVALLGALVETTSGTTAAVGAAASATQKSNTKMESPYNDELYPLLLQMHASDLASG